MGERAAILEQFRRLPSAEKLAVIDELWLEAAREVEAEPIGDAERAFLDDRMLDAELHSDEERDWEEVRKELLHRS